MLTDSQKAEIRDEEIYRYEVREELEKAFPPWQRRGRLAWEVLNSSFALWFLSSVVVAIATTAYTSWAGGRATEASRIETERRLDVELSSRVTLALSGLRADIVRAENGATFPMASYYSNVVSYLDNYFRVDPENPRDFSVYPDLRDRGFRSLAFELSTIVDTLEIRGLRTALETYEAFADSASIHPSGESSLRRRQVPIRLNGIIEEIQRRFPFSESELQGNGIHR